MFKRVFTFVGLLAGSVAIASAAMAQDAGSRVTLHGFGEWAFIRTDGNEFLDGTEDGDYDTVGLGLTAGSEIGEKLSVMGQIALRTAEEDHPAAELDYAFAQWRVSDALQVRIGRSKHPFGIYTEIFDIGTLRPFFSLPLSIYGPSEIAAQSYNGIGLTGSRQLGQSMSVDYDVYGGEITFDATQRVEEGEEAEQVRDAIGGRVRLHTPIDGFSLGASAYTGEVEHEESEEPEEADHGGQSHTAFGLHAEYAHHPFTLRAEAGRHEEADEGSTAALYVEGAYRIGTHFEVAGRYDTFDVDTEVEGEESLDHQDISAGVNYWFSSNFVIKFSLHWIDGLAAVTPVDDKGEETVAFLFGSQFSF